MRSPLARPALCALLVLAGCVGAAPASVPPTLDLPFPPEARISRGSNQTMTPVCSPAVTGAGASADRPAATHPPVPPAIQAIVNAKDRTDADRKIDAGRHPGELLAFLGLKPGMRVGELAAGGGYTTELLARAVGPTGKVWRRTTR